MRKVNPALIGFFVIVALTLFVGLLIFFSRGELFIERHKLVSYFSGDLSGLKVGSPVVFRGVPVGQVTSVRILVANEHNGEMLIPVEYELTPENLANQEAINKKDFKLFLDNLIKRGLRAKLEVASLVTGQLHIMIDFFPNEPSHLITGYSKLQQIPTVRSSLEQLQSMFESMDVEGLASQLHRIMNKVENLVDSAALHDGLDGFNATMDNLASITKTFDAQAKPLLHDARSLINKLQTTADSVTTTVNSADTTLEDVRATLGNARQVLGRADALIGSIDTQVAEVGSNASQLISDYRELAPTAQNAILRMESALGEMEGTFRDGSNLQYRLNDALREFSRAAKSIRLLAQHLEAHPESLISGNSAE